MVYRFYVRHLPHGSDVLMPADDAADRLLETLGRPFVTSDLIKQLKTKGIEIKIVLESNLNLNNDH